MTPQCDGAFAIGTLLRTLSQLSDGNVGVLSLLLLRSEKSGLCTRIAWSPVGFIDCLSQTALASRP
jgi:hypothetical protein